jgi:hypothetical protein
MYVYWLAPPTGPGIAASLVAFGDEIMRFDCLGAKKAHMHINMKQTRGFPAEHKRLYYRETSITEQIDRSCFELLNNLEYALNTNVSRRVRRLSVSESRLQECVDFTRAEMLNVLEVHSRHLHS